MDTIKMNNIRVETNYYPTSHGLGPFHPAIRNGHDLVVYYWPNVTMENETDACEFAREALRKAETAAAAVVHQWNIHSVD